ADRGVGGARGLWGGGARRHSRLVCGTERQLARLLVERGRHRQEYVLTIEGERAILVGEARVPRRPEMLQIFRGRRDRRQPRNVWGGLPRKNRSRPIGARMRQP